MTASPLASHARPRHRRGYLPGQFPLWPRSVQRRGLSTAATARVSRVWSSCGRHW